MARVALEGTAAVAADVAGGSEALPKVKPEEVDGANTVDDVPGTTVSRNDSKPAHAEFGFGKKQLRGNMAHQPSHPRQGV